MYFMKHVLQFYLLDDRLCYYAGGGDEGDIHYLPLDRIPVRALPRGYDPQIGVTLIDDRQVDVPMTLTLGQRRKQGCLFSIQCGSHTYYLAARTSAEARVCPKLCAIS